MPTQEGDARETGRIVSYCPLGEGAKLRLLATSDLHMNLVSHDYYADRADPGIGLARAAGLIQAARNEAAEALCLLVDNGDSLQGTPLGALAAEADAPHPLMAAFEALRYDAIGLGNHDFNFGLDRLDRILVQAPCPVLCANLHPLGTRPRWRDGVVLQREVMAGGKTWPIRIGMFSVLPPQALLWDAEHLAGRAETADILDTAARMTSELRARGCDLVIALAHTGLRAGPARPRMENAALPLAERGGIDAIVAGHTHLPFPDAAQAGLCGADPAMGHVHGVPCVQPGAAGSHVGVIDLDLVADGRGGWTIGGSRAHLRRTDPDMPEDPGITRLAAPLHARTRARMDEAVGHSACALHSYFSFLAPDRHLALVAHAQATALSRLMADRPEAGLPLLSAVAPCKFGGRSGPRHFTDVPPGPLSRRHIADLHVFPNDLCAVVVTGEELRDWLEMSASQFNVLVPGRDRQVLVNADFAGHNFDVIHGISYAIDLAAAPRFSAEGELIDPKARRVRNLRHGNLPVAPTDRFVVALNNYRANGGGNFRAPAGAERLPLSPVNIQNLLSEHVARHSIRDPLREMPGPWRFAPMPGTRALALTGPGALAHLEDLPGATVLRDQTAEGFVQLSIAL